jgi:outer membrane receptor protein involved in Fe transport
MKLSKIACICLLGLYSTSTIQADERTSLGEVTITGTKLSKSLQDTVESVQVFNDVDISNNAKMDDLSDIFAQTSNIATNENFNFSIRGISTTGLGGTAIGPRTIDVNIDGVSQSGNGTRKGGNSTWDLEQVEILKGPQSTTQGRNSLAGAIILKTKNPEFDANGAAKVDYSTNNTSRLSVVQTGPISDKLALRISAERSSTDGFLENDNFKDEDEYNKNKSSNIRGKLLYKFDNDADATLTLNRTKTTEDGIDRIAGDLDPFERKNNANIDGYINTDIKSYSLEINKPINNEWSSKSITSFTDSQFDRLRDQDGGSDGNEISILERDVKDFAQELRFTYQKDKLNALFGFYVASGSGTNNNDSFNLDASSLGVSGLLLDTKQKIKEDYQNIAFFTNLDYELTDKLTLIAGLRIDKDDRDNSSSVESSRVTDHGAGVNAFVDARLASLGNGNADEDNSTTNILPKLGLNYKWNNNINTGLVFSQGYRPGGISVNPIGSNASSYDAEFTDNLELSIRSNWLENTLTLNANVFYTKYKDMQVQEDGDSGSTFDINTVNAAESSLKGIEIDGKYLVNDELDIYGSLGYVKTKFNDYEGNEGNEFRYSPNTTANLGATYRHDTGYFISGNTTYTDDSFTNINNELITKSYTLTNVKVGYERTDWAVYLYANNLFDKEYLLRNSDSDGSYLIGDPRIVGVTLTYNW